MTTRRGGCSAVLQGPVGRTEFSAGVGMEELSIPRGHKAVGPEVGGQRHEERVGPEAAENGRVTIESATKLATFKRSQEESVLFILMCPHMASTAAKVAGN